MNLYSESKNYLGINLLSTEPVFWWHAGEKMWIKLNNLWERVYGYNLIFYNNLIIETRGYQPFSPMSSDGLSGYRTCLNLYVFKKGTWINHRRRKNNNIPISHNQGALLLIDGLIGMFSFSQGSTSYSNDSNPNLVCYCLKDKYF